MYTDMLNELVAGILDIMKSSLIQIVLYGSVARGTNTNESDIDVALLINGSIDAEAEDKLSNFIVDMNLKYEKVFSVIDIDYSSFQKWGPAIPFYQNVAKEGIVLWKAA